MKRVNIWRMFWILLAVIAGAYLAAVVFLYFGQARMIYFPIRAMSASPADLDLAFEDIFMATDDGHTIHGWFVPHDSAWATHVFCHGNATNISHRLEILRMFHSLKLNVFLFDYRGYGRSDGKPSEQGTYRDAMAAWRYLVEERGIPADQIIIHGQSLGGGVASWLASRVTPKALIIESSFTSIPDIAKKFYPFLPVKLLSKYQYSTKNRIKKISCPILIIHSPEDNLIPYSHGRRLYELANPPKQFVEIKGPHNSGFIESEGIYMGGISDFFETYLRP